MAEHVPKLLEILDNREIREFDQYRKKEAQAFILGFDESDWQQLHSLLPTLPLGIAEDLCRSISPIKHGQNGIHLLFRLANEARGNCLILATERLLVAQDQLPAMRKIVLPLLEEHLSNLRDGFRFQYVSELKTRILSERRHTSLAEAQEFAWSNKEMLEQCVQAACFYCQTVFDKEDLGDLEEVEECLACPYCGTEALLPDNLGFDLSASGLEALNEFWFG